MNYYHFRDQVTVKSKNKCYNILVKKKEKRKVINKMFELYKYNSIAILIALMAMFALGLLIA